jgi:cytochrome c peroxidase
MKRSIFLISLLVLGGFLFVSFLEPEDKFSRLRRIYSGPVEKWPRPLVDDSVQWQELGKLPQGPLAGKEDSLQPMIELGKILFFDPRLSGSGTISCASCHQPEKAWTDGIPKSIGHEGQINKRNAPGLHNVWFYQRLFWDGRSRDLEDQAFGPINSESEMHGDMRMLPATLRRIKGYPELFQKAYGSPGIDPDRIAEAIAQFQRTIRSATSAFDRFLAGEKMAMTDQALRGLHIFRTKAGCMNCHNGPLFSDNQFHNNGLSGNDIGLYFVSQLDEDSGKLKTPSLRDITETGPWLHDGSVADLREIVDHYSNPAPSKGLDRLIRPARLSEKEKLDLLAFLKSISAPALPFARPELPDFNQ